MVIDIDDVNVERNSARQRRLCSVLGPHNHSQWRVRGVEFVAQSHFACRIVDCDGQGLRRHKAVVHFA